MAYFQRQVNCNGTGIVSREVMARFKNGEVIMAQIQLTHKIFNRVQSQKTVCDQLRKTFSSVGSKQK